MRSFMRYDNAPLIEQEPTPGIDTRPLTVELLTVDADRYVNLIVSRDGRLFNHCLTAETAKRLAKELNAIYGEEPITFEQAVSEYEDELTEWEPVDTDSTVERLPVEGGFLYRDHLTATTTFVRAD